MDKPERHSRTFSRRINGLTGSVARNILTRTQDRNIISFAGGLPSAEIWKNLQLPEINTHAFQYGPSEGDLSLRQIFATKLSLLGISATETNTLITSGSQQGIDLVSKLYIDRDTPICVEEPTYLAALQCFRFYEAQIHSISLANDGLDVRNLEKILRLKKPQFIYLNPSFQNPSGYCYDLEERKAIAKLLDKYGVTLVEDDPYREINFVGETPPPISSFLESAPWIYLSSVSKTLLPGLRIGSLTCSAHLYPFFLKLKQATDLHTSRITQAIACSLLSDETNNAKRLHDGLEKYREKRDRMDQALRRHFSEIGDWELPKGGMFFWLRLRQAQPLDQLLEKALERGIAFMPGDPFLVQTSGIGRYIRLNFTHPNLPEIESGVALLEDCFRA